MHLGEAVICCGFGGLFLRGSTLVWPCRLLLGAGAAFSADACHGFAQHLLAVLPLPGGVTGVTSTCGGLRAGPPCSGGHWPVGGQVCASELCCKVGGDGRVPIESSSEPFSGESAQLAPVRKLRCAVVSSALAPSKPWHGHQLAPGSFWPGVHKATSPTEARLQDHRSGAPGPAQALALCARVQEAASCSGCICQPREDLWSARCSVGAEFTQLPAEMDAGGSRSHGESPRSCS